MTKEELIVGALYRYEPQRSHCRHGLAIVRRHERTGEIYAADTYWSSSPGKVDLDKHLAEFEFVLDLNGARKVNREEYDTYETKDKAWIPLGGSSEQFWIRAGATPSRPLLRQQLVGWIEDMESTIRWKQNHLTTLRERLAAFDAEELTASTRRAGVE